VVVVKYGKINKLNIVISDSIRGECCEATACPCKKGQPPSSAILELNIK
jgi:hypothetical protein